MRITVNNSTSSPIKQIKSKLNKSAALMFGLVGLVSTQVLALSSDEDTVTFIQGKVPQEFNSVNWSYSVHCDHFWGSSWINIMERPSLTFYCPSGELTVSSSTFYGVTTPGSMAGDNGEVLISAGFEDKIDIFSLVKPSKPLCSIDKIKGNLKLRLEYEPAISKTDNSQHGYYLFCNEENESIK